MINLRTFFLIILLIFSFVGCTSQEIVQIDEKTNKEEIIIENETINTEIQNSKKLIIASMETKPFKVIIDGKLTGPYIEIIETALSNLGYEYEIKIMPWNRVVESIESGTIDIGFSFFDTPERRKFAYYMQEPISYFEMSAFAMPNSDVEFDGTLESIKNYNLGIVQNYFYTSELEQAINNNILITDEAIDTPANIEKLINGRVDLIIEDSSIVKEYIKLNHPDIKLKEFETPLISNYTYLVLPKNKNYDNLRIKLDEEFKSMKADGSFYEIYKDYGLESFAKKFETLEIENPPSEKYFFGYESSPISVAVLGNTKPYTYYENGELSGFVIELLSEALDRVGVKYTFTDLPFSRMLQELENGSVDIGTDIYLNEERKKHLLYPRLPFTNYSTVFFKKSDFDFEFTGNIEKLKDYKISYVRKYFIGPLEEFKDSSDYNLLPSNTSTQMFNELIRDRTDLIIDVKSTGENIMRSLNISDQVTFLEPPLFYEYSYITFSKKNNLEILMSEYEFAIKSMYDDGTIKMLTEKYHVPYIDYDSIEIK